MEKLILNLNVSKFYGYGTGITKALDSVKLNVKQGELLCILGGSGSGKSTLLNMISCIDKPTSGSIRFKDKELVGLSNKKLTQFRANEIGFIFQFFNLIDELDVYRNLTIIPGSNQNVNRIKKLLKSLSIEDKLYSFPRQLSGGEQQRVSIARALNKKSSILLCDEPTGALDYKTGKSILKVIEDIHKKTNKTIILVTHTKEISKMCDRIVTLKSGKIVSDIINKHKVKATEVEW